LPQHFRKVVEHEPIKAPEKSGKGFARSCWGENQGAFPTRDHRPTEPLRSSG